MSASYGPWIAATEPDIGAEPGGLFDGRYAIQGLLGAGGFSKVYRAIDTADGERVALKVLSPDLAREPRFVQRFFQEARVSAGMTHPNIVRVDEARQSSCGLLYLAMQCVCGETLRTLLLRESRLVPSEAARIGQEVARALSHMHAAGVVHRDLKPENIMLEARSDGPPLVLVIDFGIARVDEGNHLAASGSISLGRLVGSPTYMSPEQIRGEPVGPQSDLYSLGVVLHELIAGRPPFAERTPVATMVQHLSAPPPPLPRAGVESGVARTLPRLIARCLAKAPAGRPASADAFLAELAGRPEPRRARWPWRLGVPAAALVVAMLFGLEASSPSAGPPIIDAIAVGRRGADVERRRPAGLPAYSTRAPATADGAPRRELEEGTTLTLLGIPGDASVSLDGRPLASGLLEAAIAPDRPVVVRLVRARYRPVQLKVRCPPGRCALPIPDTWVRDKSPSLGYWKRP